MSSLRCGRRRGLFHGGRAPPSTEHAAQRSSENPSEFQVPAPESPVPSLSVAMILACDVCSPKPSWGSRSRRGSASLASIGTCGSRCPSSPARSESRVCPLTSTSFVMPMRSRTFSPSTSRMRCSDSATSTPRIACGRWSFNDGSGTAACRRSSAKRHCPRTASCAPSASAAPREVHGSVCRLTPAAMSMPTSPA